MTPEVKEAIEQEAWWHLELKEASGTPCMFDTCARQYFGSFFFISF